ncbi:hypothetical protein N8I77_003633 [Diaporthe amygdali]|uniref:Glycosyltransferase 61 catalytic domain-containing protein n=1 Tax=Phomopsis amygdali TaxID=1214568 RepID=A0AAD9W7V2_PHOAM|nr:hypothetical protein N8I77_003633 [Diaporthe amygdali]
MAVMNHTWVPQRRLGVWVVAVILIASAYYALWTDTISVDRFRLSSAASSSCQCPGLRPEDAFVLHQNNNNTSSNSGSSSNSNGNSITTTLVDDAAKAAATNADESDLRAELPDTNNPSEQSRPESKPQSLPAHASSAAAPPPHASATPIPFKPQRDAEFFIDLPKEYELTTEDDDLCTLFYTDDYVYGIANSSKQLCNEGSAVHGFEVPTNPHHHKLNGATPVYLMQGVQWDPTRHSFNAQCSDTADKALIYGSPLPGLSYGAAPSPTCDKNSPNRQLIIYPALKETYENVWHKLMELWQNKLSYDAARIAVDPSTGQPFLTPEQAAGALVVFPDDHEGPWDDAWEILTGKPPIRYSQLSREGCYDVVVGTVGWGGPFWSALLKTTYETCRRETLLTSFTRWIFDFYGLKERPASDIHAKPTITVVQRGSTRKFRDFDQLMEKMHAQHPGYAINVVDLALMTKREQIALLQGTDVLVGHHGAGMSYVMFMRPDSAVVEILPPFFLSRGFRWVARMRGLVHFIGKAMWREEYAYRIEGVPIPDGWQPTVQGDGDANEWQTEEWVWITHEEILGLVDAAVKSQLNGIGDHM